MYFYEQKHANDLGNIRRNENATNLFHASDYASKNFVEYDAPKPAVELKRDHLDVILEERVRNIILFLGFNPKNKGFLMAVTGCIEAYKNPVLMDCLSKTFYPMLAEMYNSTPARVERCIRHELEKCHNTKTLKNINVLFKMRLWDESQRISNGIFFSLIVQKLSMELGEYR